MALDGGGSSTLAFEGTVLNSPSDGKERAVSTALMLQYYGVYAPPPLEAVVSPNGDGVAETQTLSYKVVRPSTVTATLTAPDGTIAWQESGGREPGTYDVAFPPSAAAASAARRPAAARADRATAAGRGSLDAHGHRDRRPGALRSTTTRRFAVNSTLGFASRRAGAARASARAGATATIRWTQARAARVKVTVETPEGIARPHRRERDAPSRASRPSPGTAARASASSVAGGRYVVRVTATNELGVVSLDAAADRARAAKG